ncbi:putative glutamate synthase (NADPH) [Shewanella sediminis HAW-EB3]|uniref:dihydrouracil dehydrogenase (NAD(+)) n=1 Tax=Shewanella sediminis (strain HAW-EB3) TaxID=425104 RepID=A8FS55_SHESH|nr:FAD-dependent oxidoreductase [Shewanella sediminis]ABV35678.1 putative glutamate synthase (NADPH) [Shewanella sediminis HAW-EB3]
MKKTDTSHYRHFLKVVDCQQACPAHTPVPEYIRLIADRKYTQAYMLNWESNVFPGILGRVCDRPCEPACRRGRVEDDPVAICRLKRVAADYKGEIQALLPEIPRTKNGKHIALIGAGPASLTVARDLLPLGYKITLFERDLQAGGMMRSQIPAFRLPEAVLDEELDLILQMGLKVRFGVAIDSMKSMLEEIFDVVFVGTGAPKGRDVRIPGRQEAKEHLTLGIDWLASVAFGHTRSIGERVIVLGGGNTAMDCCRTAKRLGGKQVKVVVRSTFDAMKASPWEKSDAGEEGIEIIPNHTPIEFVMEAGEFKGVLFEELNSSYDEKGKRTLTPTGNTVMMECDDVLIAIGQDTAFPWIERDIGIEFNEWQQPVLDEASLQSSLPTVFFGGDAAFGPKNIITAVAHGHKAAISIDLLCHGKDPVLERPVSDFNLVSQKMGIHEWSYHNKIKLDSRYPVPRLDWQEAIEKLTSEVELGYDEKLALDEAHRCFNCDVHTIFSEDICIECSACEDVCPVDCINFIPAHAEDTEVRDPIVVNRLRVSDINPEQELFVSAPLKTGHLMIKDEDVCLHCGLCAERCPTGAWDMKKFILNNVKAAIE